MPPPENLPVIAHNERTAPPATTPTHNKKNGSEGATGDIRASAVATLKALSFSRPPQLNLSTESRYPQRFIFFLFLISGLLLISRSGLPHAGKPRAENPNAVWISVGSNCHHLHTFTQSLL